MTDWRMLLYRKIFQLCQIPEHKDKVADTSGEDEKVEDFMAAKIFVELVKKRQFQSIDNAAYGVNDAAGKEPAKGCCGEGFHKGPEHQHAEPSHCNIKNRRKPFRAVNPETFDNHANDCHTPHKGKQRIAKIFAQGDDAHRGVRTGNQHKNHHVIHLLTDAFQPAADADGVV